jgi:hypothetical protein
MNEQNKPDAMPVGYGELTFGAPRSLVIDSMEKAWRLATLIVRAKMAPAGMDSVEAVCIAILHGAEVGLPPLMSVQRIAVIGGRPTVWGDAALAIVRNSHLMEEIDERIEGTGDSRVAYCTVTRRGEQPKTSKFSVADAKQAGLWDERPKVTRFNKQTRERFEAVNDSPWFKYKDRMLTMRARGYALRDNFADVLGGLYLREEFTGTTIEGTLESSPAPLGPPNPPEPPVTKQYVDDNAGGPPEPPEPPEPPPPSPNVQFVNKLSPEEAKRFIAQYEERLRDVQTDADLDILWNDMVMPKIDADMFEDDTLTILQARDDERRGLILTHG